MEEGTDGPPSMTRRGVALRSVSAVAAGTAVIRLLGEPDAAREGAIGGGSDDDSEDGDEEGGHGDGGHDHDGGEGPDLPERPLDSVRVDVGQDGPTPRLVWLDPGGTVTWRVTDGRHAVAAYAGELERPRRVPAEASGWASGELTPKNPNFRTTIDVPGVYDYACLAHERSGALGTVVVGRPDPADQPGLAPPQEAFPTAARNRLRQLNRRARSLLEG